MAKGHLELSITMIQRGAKPTGEANLTNLNPHTNPNPNFNRCHPDALFDPWRLSYQHPNARGWRSIAPRGDTRGLVSKRGESLVKRGGSYPYPIRNLTNPNPNFNLNPNLNPVLNPNLNLTLALTLTFL